jgi:hypothetical protein
VTFTTFVGYYFYRLSCRQKKEFPGGEGNFYRVAIVDRGDATNVEDAKYTSNSNDIKLDVLISPILPLLLPEVLDELLLS